MVLLQSETLPVGWPAAKFKLKGVDGQEYSLENFKDKQGLLVVFTCNHCPYAQAAWPLLVELHHKFGDKIGFIAINSNDPVTYPEDDFEGMKKLVKQYGVEFAYVVDETQAVAKKYKAQCTPDPYLFKNENEVFKLYYHGRIMEKNLEKAIEKLLAGKNSPEYQPPSMGCSIKWKVE